MSITTVVRVVGRTTALSVAASAHAAVTVSAVGGNVLSNYAAFLNAGANAVAIEISPAGITAVTATLPVDGTTGSYILPPLMTQPTVLAVPANTFQVSAIGSATGPALIYITPVSDQS
jgi:hypothetical protein